MSKQHDTYQIVPYTKLRRTLALTLHSAQSRSMIRGLIEVDVTKAREFLREYLSVTLSFDHTIIDGSPAARFTRWLKELIESGYGLLEGEVRYATPSHT